MRSKYDARSWPALESIPVACVWVTRNEDWYLNFDRVGESTGLTYGELRGRSRWDNQNNFLHRAYIRKRPRRVVTSCGLT